MNDKSEAPATQVRPFFRFLAVLLSIVIALVLFAMARGSKPVTIVDYFNLLFYFIPGFFFFVFAANGGRVPKWIRKKFGDDFETKAIAFLDKWKIGRSR